MGETNKPVIARRALFDLVWSKPMIHVAAHLGTSNFHVRALCDRLSLPVPVQGHWMKLEVGKAPPKPHFPADPALDAVDYEVTRPRSRRLRAPIVAQANVPLPPPPVGQPPADPKEIKLPPALGPESDHKLVRKTRAALTKPATMGRSWVGGSGKFRVHASAAAADRVCSVLSSLTRSVETEGWKLQDGDKGLEISIDNHTLGFSIEEKADTIPHVPTVKEEREKADYDRRRALAARGLAHWPGMPPQIPQNDYRPTGELVFKLDGGISVEGLRRTFSDGKKQRLEALVPDIIASVERWSVGMQHWHEQRERWRREAEDQEEQRRRAESRVRMDGYRMTFIRKQASKLDEIAAIERVLAQWEGADKSLLHVSQLLEWAKDYRDRLLRHVSPPAVNDRIEHLRLMAEESYIYEAHID